MGDDLVVVSVVVDEMMACVKVGRSDAFKESLEQNPLQFAPMDRHLRPPVPGGHTARLVPDCLAALGEVGQRRRLDRGALDLAEQSECVELSHGVRKQVDAHAEGTNLRHRFEHLDRMSLAVKAQSGHEATDARTDEDDRIVVLSHPSHADVRRELPAAVIYSSSMFGSAFALSPVPRVHVPPRGEPLL